MKKVVLFSLVSFVAFSQTPPTTTNLGLYIPYHNTYNWDYWYNANWSALDNFGSSTESSQLIKAGAVGDGVTNDSTAFQSAVNSGAAIIDGGGKTFYLANVSVPSNITIRNLAVKVIPGSATPTSAFILDGVTAPKTNVTFQNVTINGQRSLMSNFTSMSDGYKSCLILQGSVANVLIDHVTANFCGTDGLQIFSYTRPSTDNDSDLRFHNIAVSNSTFKYNRRQGISLDSAYNVVMSNVTAEYNNLDMAEIQSIYAATPNMSDLYDWISGSFTPTSTCVSSSVTGDCAARTTGNNLYGNGIDVEGYGIGSGLHDITVTKSTCLHNANGGIMFIDSTTSGTGFVARSGIRIVANIVDDGLHPNTNIPWDYGINVDGVYHDVSIIGNIVTGLVSPFSSSSVAIVGNRINATSTSYAIYTGSTTNLEVAGNETDGKGINFFDSLGTINQEFFNRLATNTTYTGGAGFSNYAVVGGTSNNPWGIGAFTAGNAVTSAGLPLLLQPGGLPGTSPVLVGTDTPATSGGQMLQAVGVQVLSDHSGGLEIGRYNNSTNTYSLIFGENSDGTATSGFQFWQGGSSAFFTITPTGMKHTGIKATTGTRYVCVDTVGNFVSSATACSGT